MQKIITVTEEAKDLLFEEQNRQRKKTGKKPFITDLASDAIIEKYAGKVEQVTI